MEMILIAGCARTAASFTPALRHAGFGVLACQDHITAIGYLHANPNLIQVALVEIGPERGWTSELLLSVRHHEQTRKLPVVVVADDTLLALELGADTAVRKPVSPTELVLRIQALLRRLGLHQAQSASAPGNLV